MIYPNRRLLIVLSSFLTLSIIHAPARSDAGRRPLTVTAALEMRRVLNAESSPVSVSPDGSRYVIRLAQDDFERDGVWVELISGRLDSLQNAVAPKTVARLFTTAKADELATGRYPPTHPANSRLVWLDENERVAFLWNDGESPTQVVSVNARTGELKQLTQHSTSVSDFAASGEDARVVYLSHPGRSAADQARTEAMLREGFAVSGTNALETVVVGNVDGVVPWNNKQLYVSSSPSASPRRVQCHEVRCEWIKVPGWIFSPDKRRVLVRRAPPLRAPAEWSRYEHSQLQRALEDARRWPDDVQKSFSLSQIALIDMDDAQLRPLWSAPSYGWHPPEVIWSPDSRSVLVGPTFLPLDVANDAGIKGTAFAEVDVATGQVFIVPVPDAVNAKMLPHAWRRDGVIEFIDGNEHLFFRKTEGLWRAVSTPVVIDRAPRTAWVRIELRQGLNSPPAFYAIEAKSGRERLILDVEPRLRTDYVLGRVENVEWPDATGRTWQGRLHYPTGHTASRRYPLVIQLVHASLSNEFSISGAGFTDGMGTTFAAQALANRGMAVLSLHRHPQVGEHGASPQEPDLMKEGVEAAVDHFVAVGLAEREQVGLAGYSRTGWYVEYILAHSRHPFGAAIAADNIDSSYVQAILTGGLTGEPVRNNGGPAYGVGLRAWLDRAPGFNAYKIRAPLRLEVDTGGVKALVLAWEMYAQLHHLRKPVELVLAPESAAASHPLQMPRQKRFSQEGTVDWMDFWLNGREDPDPRKAGQYERWRKLRALQETRLKNMRASGDEVADLPPLRTSVVPAGAQW